MTPQPGIKPGLWPIVIFLGFFCLYMALSMPSVLWNDDEGYGFHLQDRFFEADTTRMINSLTSPGRSRVSPIRHPFITLLTRPIGTGVDHYFDWLEHLHPDKWDRRSYETLFVLSLTNMFLSAAVATVFLCCIMLGGSRGDATLLTLITGFSNAALLFSIVPDHFSLSLFLLCLSYLGFFWCIRSSRIALPIWVILSVACFAVTSFNVLQPGLLFLFVLYHQRNRLSVSALFKKFTVYAVSFLMVCAVLLFIRSSYFGDEWKLDYRKLHGELSGGYTGLYLVSNPPDFASKMLLQTIIAPLVAPIPHHDYYPGKPEPGTALLYFTYADWRFSTIGWISLSLLALIVLLRLLPLIRSGREPPDICSAAIFGCLGVNLIFHSFYGWGPEMFGRGRIDIFLYSLHWLVPLCFLVFQMPRGRTLHLVLLCAFLMTSTLNNLGAIKSLYGVVLTSAIEGTEKDPRFQDSKWRVLHDR